MVTLIFCARAGIIRASAARLLLDGWGCEELKGQHGCRNEATAITKVIEVNSHANHARARKSL